MGGLRYCFEEDYVKATLNRSKPSDLAVIDTEGCEEAVRNAVKRGVFVYGYLNAGALEKERPYYEKLKHLRLARYDGWSGEYWVNPTAKEGFELRHEVFLHDAPAPEPEEEVEG